jgi:tetratricopeptide (TPR) repeat protein
MEPTTGIALYRESCVPALTQEGLASLANVHVNTVYGWERNGVTKASRLLALARIFAQLGVITDSASAHAFWEACQGKPLVPPPELRTLAGTPSAPMSPLDVGPPPCSFIPLHRNPRFVGRQGDLDRLASMLTLPQAIVAVVGMGGVGKSQLACEYSYRFGQHYPGGVFWLSFADAERIPDEIARCGEREALDLSPLFSSLPLDRQVQLVLSTWRQPIPRLLIFDNCEDAALLHRWRPTVGGCRVLVTSRLRAWQPAMLSDHIRLAGLQRADSVALLSAYLRFGPREVGAIPPESLGLLSAALDDLPLALHLAGSYLALKGAAISPGTFIAELEAAAFVRHPSLNRMGRSPTNGQEHLSAVLQRSYQLLLEDRPRERLTRTTLLHAACFIPGEPIRRTLLLATVAQASGLGPGDQADLDEALDLAIGQSLLDTAPGEAVRLHRLVAGFLRDLPAYAAAHQAVSRALCGDLRRHEERYALVPLYDLSHLQAVAREAQARADEAAADMCQTVAFQLWLHRRPGAEPLLAWAASTYGQVLGPEHPKVADAASLLGLEIQIRSRWAEARPYHEQALAIREQALGRQHPETAAAYNNLGYLLCWLADYPVARTYLQRGLQVRLGQYGLEHSDTARSIHNLGYLLLRMGRFASACRLLSLALGLRERLLPARHTSTALSLSLLGEACTRLGAYQQAHQLHERAITMWRELFGEQHPNVAEGLYRLAQTQAAWGLLEQATATLERGRAINRASLSDELGVVEGIRVVESLGVVLLQRGEDTPAQALLDSALEAWQRLLGDEHPHTARARYHLGALAWSKGDTRAAQALLQRAHDSQARLLGLQHPDTVQTAGLLADVAAHAPAPAAA